MLEKNYVGCCQDEEEPWECSCKSSQSSYEGNEKSLLRQRIEKREFCSPAMKEKEKGTEIKEKEIKRQKGILRKEKWKAGSKSTQP